MKRLLLIFVAVLAVLAIAAGIAYTWHDFENTALDDKARATTLGQYIRLSNGMVHYELTGPETARTVVLVHGFSVPYYLWDTTFEALRAAGMRVLRYDLYGRGFSDRPDVVYNGALFENQLAELIAALHIQGKVDLIGASMGGPIVAGFTCHHPELVRSVSLFDPGYSRGNPLPFPVRTPVFGEFVMTVLIAPGLPKSQMSDFAHPDRFPDWAERYRPQMRYHGFRRAILSTLRNYLTADWGREFDCLGKSSVPVFLVWGKSDTDVPYHFNQDVRAAIPRAEFLPVDDAGHLPFIEHPEIVNPALFKFLASH